MTLAIVFAAIVLGRGPLQPAQVQPAQVRAAPPMLFVVVKVSPNPCINDRYTIVPASSYSDWLSLADGGYSIGPVYVGTAIGWYANPVTAAEMAETLRSGGLWQTPFTNPIGVFP